MKEFHVTKRYEDADEEEGFYVKKIIGPGNRDLTSQIDVDERFEDNDDLVVYLSEIFNYDFDDIEVVEDESLVEFSGSPDKRDPNGGGLRLK